MRIGLFGGDTAGRTIDQVVGDARAAERDGFTVFVLPQIFGLDNMTVLAIIGREVPRIELATGVVPTYSRHPMTMAQQALAVQAASGNRFTLGIGLSHQIVVETMWGLSFEKPLRHMREYLAVLLPLLRDGAVSFSGETISTQGALDVAGRSAPPVIVAALGPKMLELAGTVADGTATWMTGAETLASYTVPTITAAADRAGRAAPRVMASFPVCVTGEVDLAKERAATEFQVYGILPSYRAMLDREGAAGPSDIAIIGDENTVAKRVGRLADAGVTDFIAVEYGTRLERERTREVLRSLL